MMSRKLIASAATAAVLAAAAATALVPAQASAAPAPVTRARIAEHFDIDAKQTPENIALAPDGTAYVTFAKAGQVARISPSGTVRVLATLPVPADGGVSTPVLNFPLTVGIVRAHDGTLYFLYATGTADLTGVWRLRPGDGGAERIAALPARGLPNGLALAERTGTLYATDSVLGTIWSVPETGGTPTAWSTAPELASTGFLGANGLKIHGGALWVGNLDKGTVLRIPVRADGSAGRVRTVATGLAGIDDFAFTGRGDQLLAALNGTSEVALVRPGGSHTVVMSPADGLQNPTAVAVRGSTVYVVSAAYVTGEDPNLVLARLN
jgi:sugar lactone lactonase YvrE